MISKHGMIWDDETIAEKIAATRKFIDEQCRKQAFDARCCPRGALCVHDVQCPGTQRRT